MEMSAYGMESWTENTSASTLEEVIEQEWQWKQDCFFIFNFYCDLSNTTIDQWVLSWRFMRYGNEWILYGVKSIMHWNKKWGRVKSRQKGGRWYDFLLNDHYMKLSQIILSQMDDCGRSLQSLDKGIRFYQNSIQMLAFYAYYGGGMLSLHNIATGILELEGTQKIVKRQHCVMDLLESNRFK